MNIKLTIEFNKRKVELTEEEAKELYSKFKV
jgi:hypothetical protein